MDMQSLPTTESDTVSLSEPTFADFDALCGKAGLVAHDCGNGHWQVKGGKFLVNFWPFSFKKTIHVANGPRFKGGTMEQAIECAGTPEMCKPLDAPKTSLQALAQAVKGDATGIKLCDEQEEAVAKIHGFKGVAIALTGQAGSGKSTVVDHLRKTYPRDYTVTATTGKAALLVGGRTVDSLFCFSRDKWKVFNQDYLEFCMRECADKVIIDEASMVGRNMGDLLWRLAREFRKTLVLVGDWAQASPVKDRWPIHSKLFHDIEFIKLVENHRQGEGEYLDALNKIRQGKKGPDVAKVFKTCEAPEPPPDERMRVYATNKKVDAYNEERLDELVERTGVERVTLEGDIDDCRTAKQRERKPFEKFEWEDIAQMFDNASLACERDVALGARMLITRNSLRGSSPSYYVNGDTGELVNIVLDKEAPVFLEIRLDRGGTIKVERQVIEVENSHGSVNFRLKGFPVKLGWAATVHKMQGMTVHKVWVDMASIRVMATKESMHGLAYVALSRTKTIEGLQIGSWCPDVIHCSPAIRKFI